MKRRVFRVGVALAAAAIGAPLFALVRPASSAAAEKAFRHPALVVAEEAAPAAKVTALSPGARDAELAELGATPSGAFFDARTGRWSSLMLSGPMLPGAGVGNRLSWISGRPPANDAEWRAAAAAAVLDYVKTRRALRIDLAELGATPRAAVLDGGNLIYVHIPRIVGGVPVRDNAIAAVINHGNLVLLGMSSWGDVDASLVPAIAATDAAARADAFLAPLELEGHTRAPRLELAAADGGDRLTYRLVWVLESRVKGDVGRWETLVDAKSGEILAFQDLVQYASRQVVGGVFPVSNDGSGPEGTEQLAWPMPWADVFDGTTTSYTDGGGNAGCIPGSISTTLTGLYVKVTDTCGFATESSAGDVLDLGAGAGTDCTVPAGHSTGDTHAGRTGFYELNRMKEQARGQLPSNPWLQQQLIANMNLVNTCNAFWNGTTVNFYRSGGGCGNTGEIAAVFDHEWGHGMDNNGTDPTISSPGEAIADIYAALRLNTSCIGRGFHLAGDCTGYGDACLDCTGIRDIDWAKHTSGDPHDLDSIAALCSPAGTRGPCDRETHCEGTIVAEVAWDLATRDLTAPPFSFGSELAREVTTRLFYLGSQVVKNWYVCVHPDGGCAATGGYLNILAADDDNGTLADGTPHMTAIAAAFNRHQVGCTTPAAANSGCAGGPTTAPALTVLGLDRSASLTWTAVANATRYAVFRTEGTGGCDFGKVKVTETADLAWVDAGLQNGRTYRYNVQAIGSTDACFGPMSECESAAATTGAGFALASSPVVSGGDGDEFLDNCEAATASFDLTNSGAGNQTNVRIVAIEPLTHPSTIVVSALPIAVAASLDECATTAASIAVQAQGLSYDDTSDIRITLASDQLDALGQTRQITLRFLHTESDLTPVGSHTFSFETDLERWKVVSGTFARTTGGGGNGTAAYLSSSAFANAACDVIRSPVMRVHDSMLSLYLRYNIEPLSDRVHDRANVSVYDDVTGASSLVTPNAGNSYYNSFESYVGPCVTSYERGWIGTSPSNPSFDTSVWNGTFNPGGIFDGKLVRIEVAYGTDEALALDGFDFDEVALSNVELQVPDTQPDVCIPGGGVAPFALHVDASGNGVLEAGEAAVVGPSWTNPGADPVTLTGIASNFTGPAGPVYTLTDATGSYGTIAGSGSAFCTDCYAVSIAAGVRPTPHWDASLLETPSEAVPAKTWTLHVGGSFPDVLPASPFYPAVENVLHNGVTAGCGNGLYCPTFTVTRQQMAVFLLKAREGAAYAPPACVAPAFPDVPCDNPFAPWINELVARGVTAGCGGGNYCPANPTTRQQMAVFLLKDAEGSGYTPPACSVPQFPDVPCDSPFAAWVNELVARGVTAGCGGGNYCPTNPVQRQQMAVFLVKTFGLKLYGP